MHGYGTNTGIRAVAAGSRREHELFGKGGDILGSGGLDRAA
ncbi:hypothetical protein [Streptomyces sp. NPDC005548]